MNTHTYYTAVGHFRRKSNGLGQSYPVVIISQREYIVDIQEMALWTALSWRLLEFPQIRAEYDKLDHDCAIPARRTMEDCLGQTLRRCMTCWAGCMCPRCPRACLCVWRRF